MSDKETGGSAFPTGTWEYDGQNNVLPYQEGGMTLRDYFAAKAMQALIPIHREQLDFDLCKSSYKYADAMLEARK